MIWIGEKISPGSTPNRWATTAKVSPSWAEYRVFPGSSSTATLSSVGKADGVAEGDGGWVVVFFGWGVAVTVGRGLGGGLVVVLDGVVTEFGGFCAPLQPVHKIVTRMTPTRTV